MFCYGIDSTVNKLIYVTTHTVSLIDYIYRFYFNNKLKLAFNTSLGGIFRGSFFGGEGWRE